MVRTGTASAETLPLTHITDAYMFRQIMEVEALAPSGCPVFEEELLYLFYGRPAYRAADEETSNGIDAYWPICFVMMPSDVTPKRVYPFDSGAFHHKRYAEFMYHRMIKEDFELESDPSMPGRLVSLFWSDIQGYFENKGPRDFVPGPFEFEDKAYYELIRHKGRGPFDERGSTIEIQIDHEIPIKGNTLAVILPYEFATDAIIAKIESMGALALPFNVVSRNTPSEIVGHIYSIARELLSGNHGRIKCW